MMISKSLNCRGSLLKYKVKQETLRYDFKTESSAFWMKVKQYKEIIESEAIKVILLFATTYLCEAGFLALTVAKTKFRNRFQPEYDLRCSLS
jgi:hypothetical protein